jgi:hypothetical protein
MSLELILLGIFAFYKLMSRCARLIILYGRNIIFTDELLKTFNYLSTNLLLSLLLKFALQISSAFLLKPFAAAKGFSICP